MTASDRPQPAGDALGVRSRLTTDLSGNALGREYCAVASQCRVTGIGTSCSARMDAQCERDPRFCATWVTFPLTSPRSTSRNLATQCQSVALGFLHIAPAWPRTLCPEGAMSPANGPTQTQRECRVLLGAGRGPTGPKRSGRCVWPQQTLRARRQPDRQGAISAFCLLLHHGIGTRGSRERSEYRLWSFAKE
jgi:hypothetical protein